MKTIYPVRLYLENFQSYEKQLFVFPRRGSHAIVGINKDDIDMPENGAGKTTLMEAIVLCMTGKTLKGYRGDSIIREGEKRCKVHFYFQVVEDGVKKIGYIALRRNPNRLRFFDGTKFIRKHSIPETQKAIQKFFGLDFEILTKFFLVGEQEKYKFSFLGSDDSEKKKLLTKLTKSQVIDEAYEIVNKKMKHARDLYSEAVVLYEDLEARFAEIKEKMVQAKTDLGKGKIVDLKFAMKKMKKKKKQQERIVKASEAKFETAMKALRDYEDDKYERINTIETLEEAARRQKEEAREKLLKTERILAGAVKCPKCGYEITDSKHDKKELTKKLNEGRMKLKFIEKELNNFQLEKKSIVLYKEEKLYKTMARAINDLNFYIEDQKEKLKNITKDYERARREYFDVYSVSTFSLKELFKEQKSLKEKCVLAKQKVKIHEGWVALLKKFDFFFGKEGYKNFLFSKKLKLVESVVNDVLLQTGTKMQIELSGMTKLKSGKYNQKVSGKVLFNGRKRDYLALSKGERRRIDLAFIFAFGKLLNFKTNFMLRMFDEPFSGLDKGGEEKIVSMLQSLDILNYILIPKSNFAEEFYPHENIVYVIKEKGRSRIEV